MLFQTPAFFAFYFVVFSLYWLAYRHQKLQNALLLVASYVFYGWWDWRLLGLIFAACTCDFLIAGSISKASTDSMRWRLLQVSIALNLSILGFFKYYNFFISELERLAGLLGCPTGNLRLDIILPVGVSFYTFQTMSYTIDVYMRRLPATRDPIAYLAYIAFFPQLVAGPIERATHLLPQFLQPRQFSYRLAVMGCRLVLWGFFKKLIVGDLCSDIVNDAFQHHTTESGWNLVFACIAFAFQIYGDFSGYSDIARGLSLTMGFHLMQNFAFPYFARSPVDFWRRWHISLSTWFRDYVYYPLGGNRVGVFRRSLNIVIVFVISGIWHGANWTFLIWGLVNGLMVAVCSLSAREKRLNVEASAASNPALSFLQRVSTFAVICSTWILFRSSNLSEAREVMIRIAQDCVTHPGGLLVTLRRFLLREPATIGVTILVGIEWLLFTRRFSVDSLPRPIRWLLYLIISSIVAWLAFYRSASEFIYFQF